MRVFGATLLDRLDAIATGLGTGGHSTLLQFRPDLPPRLF